MALTRSIKVAWVGAAALTAALATAPGGWGGIAGSKHDLSSKGWMPNQEVCVVCHGPHNAQPTGGAGLLWNHQMSAAVFTPFSSPTLKSTVGQPDGASKMCLSCHDGTIAVDAFGGQAGTEICGKVLGTDLRKTHPLSMVFNDALAALASHLKPPSTTPSGLGGTIAQDMLRDGKFQCVSCHEPHNRYNREDFLVKQNGMEGRLCGTCHYVNNCVLCHKVHNPKVHGSWW